MKIIKIKASFLLPVFEFWDEVRSKVLFTFSFQTSEKKSTVWVRELSHCQLKFSFSKEETWKQKSPSNFYLPRVIKVLKQHKTNRKINFTNIRPFIQYFWYWNAELDRKSFRTVKKRTWSFFIFKDNWCLCSLISYLDL